MPRSTFAVCLLAIFSLLCATHVANAQTDLAMMTTPWRAASPIDAGGGFLFLPTETDSAATDDLDLSILRAAGRFRPDRDSEQKLTFAYDFTYLDLDTADAALPERLSNTTIAAGLMLGTFDAFDQTWQYGGSLGVGHASSNAFGDGQGWYGLGAAFATTRLGQASTLTLGVDFNGNRAVFPDLPLPAILYATRYNEQLSFVLGFPVNQLIWTPDDYWTVRLAAAGIAFSANVQFKLDDKTALFAAYGGDGDAFHVADADSNERLFYSAQIVEAGVSYGLTDQAKLTVSAGLAFDQEFETGFDLRDTDTVRELDNTAFFRVGGRLEF